MSKLDDLIKKLCPDLPAGRQVGWSTDELPDDNNVWYVYVLLCNDGTLYKGFTKNLYNRFKRHLAGDGAEYTRRHTPISVLYYEICSTEKLAVEREKYFKSGCDREWLKEKIREMWTNEQVR